MELIKLTDRFWYSTPETGNDRPVLGYVAGSKFPVYIDCGNSPAHLSGFEELLKAHNLPPANLALITHWHWDHTFGMHAFNGKTIAGKLTNQKLREVANWQWTDSAMKNRLETGDDIAFCDECIRVEYTDLSQIKVMPADIEFSGELAVDLGGVHCIMSSPYCTHSKDSIFIMIPEEKILFAGDGIYPDVYVNLDVYDKKRLAGMIEYLENLDFEVYIEGHDIPKTKQELLLNLRTAYKEQ